MSTYRLDNLFAPRSVALVGASHREGSVGRIILRNLREGGFQGVIHLVNPRYADIDGTACVPRIEDLPDAPDLVVTTAPPPTVPGIVAAAGARGVAAAIIITAGLGHGPGSLADVVRLKARKHGLRLVGPNCLGVLAPRAKLNASFAARSAAPGDLALISQSGAIAAGLVEWAAQAPRRLLRRGVAGRTGRCRFRRLPRLLRPRPRHPRHPALHRSHHDARKFMSAARAAARMKPVVVIKSGRHAQGARAAATHTGALAGSDAVYDAAFRRAGLLRVFDLDEIFAAAETLGRREAVSRASASPS